MPSSYYKIGTDVYGTEEGKLNLDQFQSLGLNYDLLGEGRANATSLDSGRDVETRSFISQGGQLGGASAAVGAGYTFDPTTGQMTTPAGSGSFGAGAVPTTQAVNTATQTLADKLKSEGAVTTSQLPQEQNQFYKTLEDQLKKSDDYASQLMSLYVPSAQENKIQSEIDQTLGAAEAGINQEADRPATMGFITGAQASIERRANAKLSGLQREIQRLQGNREGQQKAIAAAYDIKRQNIQDAISFYKMTAPDMIATDEKTGTVYFRNPITGQVTATKLPGYQPKEAEQPTTAGITEYEYAKKQGYTGSYLDFKSYQALQYGTEGAGGTSGGGTADSTFTSAQINKGAAYAGMSIEDFKKLDTDTANFFINNQTALNTKKKLIDAAKGSGEDPRVYEKEISESNLPDAVKDYLVKYLKSVFATEYQKFTSGEESKPWWQKIF